MITFTIPSVPPSYNKSFKINYNLKQIYLSQEARSFKKLVFLNTPNITINNNDIYSLSISIYNNWYNKDSSIKRKDIQNMDKLLIDAMFERLGCDDSRLWQVHMLKVQSNETKTVVSLEVLNV